MKEEKLKEEETLQVKVNNISEYLQVNKAFRHIYGVPAALVLGTFLHKYRYFDEMDMLKPIKTKNGNVLYYFHLSKFDLSLDSGVSISMLEKENNSNPLIILKNLKMIEIIHSKKANYSDNFVLFPNRIINEVENASKLFYEDKAMNKLLPRTEKRNFLKALNGKLTRDEVHAKYKACIDPEYVLDIDDNPIISGIPVSIEETESPYEELASPSGEIVSSSEGITKNTINNISKKSERRKTNTNSLENGSQKDVYSREKIRYYNNLIKGEKITIEIVEEGIMDYGKGNVPELTIHGLLKNIVPKKAGAHWEMSEEDAGYIKRNLSSIYQAYIQITLDQIDGNIQNMTIKVRKMRFGSILVGVHEMLEREGMYDNNENSNEENDKPYSEMPEEEEFEFIDKL